MQRKQQNIQLAKNYKNLQDERDKIEQLIKDHGDLDESQIQGNIYISQKYSMFIFLTIICVIIVFIFFKIVPSSPNITNIQQGGSVLSNKVYILIFIMMLITLATLKSISK